MSSYRAERAAPAAVGMYFLPDGAGGIRAATLDEWAAWFQEMDNVTPFAAGGRHVGDEVAADGVRVSTVFMGLSHSLNQLRVFETIVFGGTHDGFQRRYGSLGEALAGHASTVQMVKGA